MATDLVQADFSGATAGTDLAAFTPAVGSAFVRHPSYSGGALVATADGHMRAGTTAENVYTSSVAPPSADYSVRVKVTARTLTGKDLIGPTIRCANNVDSFYTLVWIAYNGIGNGVAMYKHVNGTPANVGSLVTTVGGVSTAPVAGTSAVLEIAVVGTTLTGYFNGVAAITMTDADLAGPGYGGIYAWSGAAADGSGIQADQFYLNPDPTYAPTTAGAAPAGGTGGSGGSTPTPTPTPVTIPVTSVGHWCSPLNWDDDGTGVKPANGVRARATAIWSASPGAHARFRWTTAVASGNVAALQVDVSPLVAGSVPTSSYPKVKFRVGVGPWHVAQVGAGTNGTCAIDVTAAGISGAGDYTLRYYFMASDETQPRWAPPSGGTIPPNVLKVTGLVVDPGSTPAAPAVLPRTLAVFGDSITEGFRVNGTAGGDLAGSDSTLTYAQALAAALGAEPAAVGFGGQAWTGGGMGGVPAFPAAFGFYSAGRARDFAPPVDAVVCVQGTNDGLGSAPDAAVTAAAAAWLATARGKWATARIFLAVPPGGYKRAALTAAFARYQAATPDASAFLLDGGAAAQAGLDGPVFVPTFAATDGVHPDAPTHARVAAILVEAINAASGQDGQPSPAGPVGPSGASFAQLQSGGLSGQVEALIRANPGLDPAVVDGLRAGRTGAIDGAYRGLASLVESYLRGDPIATADVNARLGAYAAIFAGYAQAAAEVASLAEANPGTIVNLPNAAHAVNTIARRTFN